MKLVAILRIKDEVLVVRDCLSKLSALTDEIIILDNGSTDGTLAVYREFNKIVKLLNTEGYHEGRDKCLLLEEAKKRNPDWIIWIDGDEVFESHFTREIVEKYMNSRYNKISFKLYNLWLSSTLFRVDGPLFAYTMRAQRDMWRNLPSGYFSPKKMHNGAIRAIPGPTYISPYRLKHFGAFNKTKLQEKYQRYLLEDKSGERSYKHMNPDVKTIRLKLREFKNKHINLIYIVIYKYLTELVRYAMIATTKIKMSLK